MWGLRVLQFLWVEVDGFFKIRLEITPVKIATVSADLDESNQYKMMYWFLFFNKKPQTKGKQNQKNPKENKSWELSVSKKNLAAIKIIWTLN